TENRALRRQEGPHASRRPRHHPQPPQNRLHNFQRASLFKSAAGIWQLRLLSLAIRRRKAHRERLETPQTSPSENKRVRRHEQGFTKTRLPFCRLDDLLRLHAGHRHGQRSPRHLLSLPPSSVATLSCAPCTPLLRLPFTIKEKSPHRSRDTVFLPRSQRDACRAGP